MESFSSTKGSVSADVQAYDRSTWWLAVGIISFYLILYIVPLGARPLTIPDESRYAEIPREILSTGDWVVPRYNGLRYFEKPPLGYWINAVSFTVFGENAFAARLPSALAAGLTALLVFLFTRMCFGSQRIALYAALIQMSCLEIYAVGTMTILDNYLALFLTGGILSFYLAAQTKDRKQALGFWVTSGVCLGLAFLAKGFLALAIPVLVLVPWMLWQGKWRSLLGYGWLVGVVALLFALPWAMMIHVRESDFWHYFFWIEHIQRFTANNAQHKAPFYYFLMFLPLAAFPWLTLAPAALSGLKGRRNMQSTDAPLFRFLWLWFFMPFLFFSISSGKLVTYILPCFPPLALLTAIGLHHYLQRPHTPLFKAGLLFNIAVIALALAALVAVQSFGLGRAAYEKQELFSYISLALSLVAVLIGGFVAIKSKKMDTRLAGVALCSLPLLFVAHFAFPEQVLKRKSPGILLHQYVEQIPADALVIADSYIIGAVAWVLKRQDIYLTSPGELNYGLEYPEAAYRWLTPTSFSDLLQHKLSTHSIVMICSEGCDKRFLPKLPSDAVKYSYGIFDMWIIRRQT